ncbi:tRNA pseudouridine(38/39) synthase isoform X2 [Oryzias melastigma]|uniref:tRNA pseudouridine(38/39) synthase isoform X2 n=1 Tax=Oryzias melastigma TaxID=30732 RepID=UPI000CF81DB4|nr:tRNA pseudouridine(38/39) synthase isoform X2 [Oryzias melastigma]
MSDSLISRIKELEAEVEKLKSQLKESREAGGDAEMTSSSEGNSSKKERKKSGKERPFDFAAHPRRHVALRLAYLGWAYQGFAVQENTDNTVEARLFEALLKTRLIQDRQSSNYHRCGRTDKGVSAFSQVITIDLRSTQFCGGLGVTVPEKVDSSVKSKASSSELPYVKMLNRVLPQDIRILDWAPVAEGFSARFDCQSRTYRYYFPRGSLDVALMEDAAKRYEGTHDFRNLCKMDVGNGVLQFERTILSATVRCMMAVLLLIGQKLEEPQIINQLLDVENNPRKPQYSMAVDYPLVLHDCHFEGLEWQQDVEELNHVLSSLQQHWIQSAVKAHVLRGMMQDLEDKGGLSSDHCWLVEGSRQKNYRRLLERPCCESLESRINYFVKRGRLEREEGENGEETLKRGKRPKHCHSSSTQAEADKQAEDQKAGD